VAGTVGCALVGAAIGFGMHEGAHQLVGAGDIHWEGAEWKCPDCSPGRAQTIALAGYVFQGVANELLLGFDVPREHPVIAGFLLWNILNPITAVIRNEAAGPSGAGDLGNLHDRPQRRIVEGALAGVAALQGLRLALDDRFPLLIRSTEREIVAVLRFRF
jgi:hypothetical protein